MACLFMTGAESVVYEVMEKSQRGDWGCLSFYFLSGKHNTGKSVFNYCTKGQPKDSTVQYLDE